MVALTWGPGINPRYESGIDKGVLYIPGANGVSWSGLSSIKQNQLGGEVTPHYLDTIKYMDFRDNTDYQATLTAFSAPVEFMPCYGHVFFSSGFILTRQPRIRFGLSYRTQLGSKYYKIHLVYNATASPTKKSSLTLSNSQEAGMLEWTIDATPPQIVSNFKPTAHFIIDSSKTNAAKLLTLENLLYGTVGTNAALPTQDVVISTLS